MRRPRLRTFAPKSLYGRTILIVVLPIFLMQVVVTIVFFDRHWEEVTSRLAKGTTGELALLTELWEEADDADERAQIVLRAREQLELDMGFVRGEVLPPENNRAIFEPFDQRLNRELRRHLSHPYAYDAESEAGVITVGIQLPEGVLTYRVPRKRVLATDGHLFVLWLVGATVLLGYAALVFLRNQVRSITRLAEAAEAFGRGRDIPDFKPTGAREVRQAGTAFLAMRARIRRYVRQRTEMLAGVSHDLRTPLTRMKLNLEMLPDGEEARDLRTDVAEMERMLQDYLTFASGEAEAAFESVDLAALADEVCAAAARAGRIVTMWVPPHLTVEAKPTALRRALDNLVGNALRHARTVTITVEAAPEEVLIHVDDDGPGIPAERRAEAVRAFSRLEEARTGASGTGLGLAIVRDLARSHGGKLILSEAPIGGLRATISLPR
ncbi:ATP-binding protein [Parvularcula dongshanensis]|uniref:histidine kinase n=1 Tax=Parvularcula dongshanensis TaxID=1173995 RepID=A0A840I4A3_9PROT|nr:ATP-binding protein [Parvularcula dongshanensis]MBB4659034.1 two-component system osmolarity sensor histidine kinase EnvZ [Parvularcula dongshanensis]